MREKGEKMKPLRLLLLRLTHTKQPRKEVPTHHQVLMHVVLDMNVSVPAGWGFRAVYLGVCARLWSDPKRAVMVAE